MERLDVFPNSALSSSFTAFWGDIMFCERGYGGCEGRVVVDHFLALLCGFCGCGCEGESDPGTSG